MNKAIHAGCHRILLRPLVQPKQFNPAAAVHSFVISRPFHCSSALFKAAAHTKTNYKVDKPLTAAGTNNKMTSQYTCVEKGAPQSTNYRLFFKNGAGAAISPLHDIPLFANSEKTIYNMVVEVPRWTNAKMEISLKEKLNPIMQDVKKGNLRYVANCFPHKGYIWNYGAFPQTWENPEYIEPSTGCKGDNDPIDVLEIGYRVAKRGQVVQVKVLGAVALIDEGETDWKIVAIDVTDPVADKVNDIADVDKWFPGLLRATVEWFKIYKIPDGKPENVFAFNGEAKNAEFAANIVSETNKFWQQLVKKEQDAGIISCANTSVADSPFLITAEEAAKAIEEAPEGGESKEIPDHVDKWHFISLKLDVFGKN